MLSGSRAVARPSVRADCEATFRGCVCGPGSTLVAWGPRRLSVSRQRPSGSDRDETPPVLPSEPAAGSRPRLSCARFAYSLVP